jgi:hypothetical protein
VTCAGPQPFAEIVTRDNEIVRVISYAADDQVNVGMLRIPMVDGDPVEFRSKIPFGLCHQVSGEGLQVRELLGVVGRHDEAEVMAIFLTTICEGPMVGILLFRIKHPPGSPVLRYAFAAQVLEVGAERRPLDPVADDTGLDHRAARSLRQYPVGG